MWILFGVIALAATLINLYVYAAGKDYKLAMALGLSFTALTLCAEYSLVSEWVNKEDWSLLGKYLITEGHYGFSHLSLSY